MYTMISSFFYSLLNNIKTISSTATNISTTTTVTTSNSTGNENYTDLEWEKLFFKVMRNIYLRKEILHHVYLFNCHKDTVFSDFNCFMNYKYKEYCTILDIDDSVYITSNMIPNYITTISFYNSCELDENVISKIPNSVTSLKLCNTVPVKVGIISNNIKVLTFLQGFKKNLIVGFIPTGTVEQVYFDRYYQGNNIPVGAIPEGVKVLHLPCSGNTIGKGFLPGTLKELSIGKLLYLGESKLNYIGEGVIPNGVIKLTLDGIISTPVANYSLVQGVIPTSVTYLEFKSLDAEIGEFAIPCSVKTLIFGSFSRNINPTILPSSITYLDLGDHFNQELKKDSLPSSITHLIMGKGFSRKLNKCSIPSSVKYLKFGRFFNVPLETGDLFDNTIENGISNCNLCTLIFGEVFNQIIEIDILPHSIEHLEFGFGWNKTIKNGSFPLSCKKLIFGSNYNKSIDSQYQLPPNLEELTFGFDFNYPLIPFISLPISGSLKYLNLGRSYNHPIEIGTFPDSLTTIKFGYSFRQPLSFAKLPKSIKLLQLSSSYDLNLLSTDIPVDIIEKPNQT